MQFQLTLFVYLGLLRYARAPDDCSQGACRPPTGDLLVGRGAQLTASSTCGLKGAQKYCILSYLEREQKCFMCDSRFPYDPYTQPNSHTIENVITSFEPDREKKWWQSENGLDHVSIRLDLEAVFQFSHLILTFKTFRPAAMLIERSTDYGHTWKVFKYFAKDCAASFPSITSGQAQEVGDLVCDSRYSDIEPSTGGEVVLKILDPTFEIENPYSSYIQDLVTLTNLRINFTKLHTLGDTLLGRRQNDSLDKYYYALYEMVVRGSCFCNGHARECSPMQKVRGDVFSPPGMVHGQCVCQHNTDGPNCEQCKDFFQDAPWRPAGGPQDSTCKPCNCHGHSERCHFDMTVYLESGGLSGGVCEDCRDHTEGQHCDRCRPLFYRDLLKPISDPYACIPCECDPDGTLSGGICVSHYDPALGSVTGQCLCKENVEGTKCDQCKPNHYGLSAQDPLGCQPCNCHPLGTLPFSTCDVDTGQCLCQASVTGLHCEECTVGYWGLGNHLHGCVPCDCDIGGAYSNMCSPEDGQCECRPHITGRRCTEPAPGYFFAPLSFYLYEAEEALPLQGLMPLGLVTFGEAPSAHVLLRESVPGQPDTWTGPGFARVLPGAGLRFAVNNVPFPMDFTVAIRYETQSRADWTVRIVVNPPGGRTHCTHKTPQPKPRSFALPAAARIMLLPTPICLEPGIQYSIDVYFSQPMEGESHAHSHILVDSLGLIPRISSLENFCSKQDLDEYRLYNCAQIASEMGPRVLPDACERLIVSMSAKLHNGAVACKCHPQGSVGTSCSRLGGQCQCRPGVAGRCCDRCSPGSYSLAHHGCHSCHCHPQGSKDTLCDQVTGQCLCHKEVGGRRCDQCLAGYFGFPNCHPCSCNGFAELCDPVTGSCFNCGGFTTGQYCERCIDGYYGNPSSGQPCRPCRCPDTPSSNQYFALSCYQAPWSSDVICNCLQGYTGIQCGECSPGFYRNPRISGAPCRPCACNDNIDVTDPGACSQVTGECLKCLHNTWGPNCHLCKPGHFGSALNQTCRRCSCHPSGVNPARCSSGEGPCLCDPATGSCPCLPNVSGLTCDRCADGYWNLVPGRGCQSCDCDPQTSQSDHCDQLTGQCPCKLGYGGKHCNECRENYYGDPPGPCVPCDCHREGAQKPACDSRTGMCLCRAGVGGQRCDHCAQGHGQEFPACLRCHSCFDQWNRTISALSELVQGLMRLAVNIRDKRGSQPVCEADFKGLSGNVSEIERMLNEPVFSSGEFLRVKDYHDFIGKQIMQLSEQLQTVYEFQDLNKTIVRLRTEADLLLAETQEEVDLHSSARNTSIMDASEDIKKYHQISTSAEKKINEAILIINISENTRNDSLHILDTVMSTGNISLEKLKQIKIPDIQILNEKVCGKPGHLPCVLAPCGGALCKDLEGHRHCGGPSCGGSLTLSRNALQKAQETETMIQNLDSQVKGLKNQIKNISKLTEVSTVNVLELSEKMETIKNQSESEKDKINLLINKMENFLSEENVPPEDIEKVAKHVLGIHLQITSHNLTQELDRIKEYVHLSEDNRTDESLLTTRADEIQKLLMKAQVAENTTSALFNLDELLRTLQGVQITQGGANSTITQLNAEIRRIRKKILQAEDRAKKSMKELNSAQQLSDLEDRLPQLRTKLQRNQDRAASANAQAESAVREAEGTEKEFVELKKQHALLQHKTSTTGKTLGKLKQLKDVAEKMAVDTEDKLRRITDLEKKIHDLNQSKQEKADQLRHLEDRVIAIKNEIVEEGNKYASCYS
ncbi:PREDICTED: laminin subunit beta-4 [Elephantulus edwardii]|uniref:laminin subunit beta-4 n=1 Tax=Elephantulus edwardii TaxID=28737 RepID=UPI0003F06DE7|nr:PREDICTED: laminin subunit beta-4 [Elephantulus edwardii]